jgi:hypothetical protein
MDFTHVSGYMPFLSYMLNLFYSGAREVWSIKGELLWNKTYFKMPSLPSRRV